METIIKIEHLSKIYHLYDKPIHRMKEALSISRKCYHKEHKALNDITIHVNRGDSIGFVGKNGAGKSTLLKIITGVLNPTSGTIEVNGKIAALLELGAGFNMEYTGRENIALNGTMMGYTEAEMKEREPSIIEFADIGEFIDQPVKTYSSGMFARLAFAVAINVQPDILIVDEALAVGDTRFQIKCIDKMKELKEQGTTILFVSHAVEQIKRFCNRAIWMDHGEVKIEGEASEIVDLYENHMKYGLDIDELLKMQESGSDEQNVNQNEETEEKIQNQEENMSKTANSDLLASIDKVSINKEIYHTFDELEVSVDYTIYEENIEGFLFGVAIYTADRKEYIFGPNTFLENVEIPNTAGKHRIVYRIPKLMLIQGAYAIDVGIFNNEGIVNLDYKMSAKKFTVSNKYFSEGMYYMEHSWNVEK